MKDSAKCRAPSWEGSWAQWGPPLSLASNLSPTLSFPGSGAGFLVGAEKDDPQPRMSVLIPSLFYDPDLGSGLRKAVLVYFSDFWNKLDVCAILLFIAGLTCRWAASPPCWPSHPIKGADPTGLGWGEAGAQGQVSAPLWICLCRGCPAHAETGRSQGRDNGLCHHGELSEVGVPVSQLKPNISTAHQSHMSCPV